MSKEPLFWYRPRTDGGYEGPLHNGQIGDVRKASGAWVPLFAGAAPAPAFSVGARGVGIIDDNPSALAVYFNAAPNDDDIRTLHEIVSAAQVATTSPALAQGEARMNKGITRGKDGNLAQEDGPEVATHAPDVEPICWVWPAATIPELHGFQVCREGQGFPVWAHPPAAQTTTRPTVTLGMIARAEDVLNRAQGASFHRHVNDALEAALDVAQKDGQFSAQAQPDPRTPADMKVNGGALKLALNALRRSGKNEIADELEKTAMPAQQSVSGADQFRDATKMVEQSGNSGELPSDGWLTGCVGVQNQGGLHQITGLADIRRFAECVLKHRGNQDADKVGAEPDMFWNADNPEQCQDSIHNLLVELQCDRTLRAGDIVEIQQAMSMPNISVRVTAVDTDDDDGDLEYEIVMKPQSTRP